MRVSRYDELHDRYYGILRTGRGTKYELLAAVVFKSLDEAGVVIHDLDLVGESGAEHQIDVKLERNGKVRRILIECKDFDVSGRSVGLSIVRNFWGVVDDIKPDESFIVTCNDFSSGAKKFAKYKGIKLAILREFQEEDWEGRIKTIEVTLDISGLTESTSKFHLVKKEHGEKLVKDAEAAGLTLHGEAIGVASGQPVYLNTPEGRFQINEFIKKKYNEYPRDTPGPVTLEIPLEDSTIEVEKRGGVPIIGIELKFEVYHTERTFEVGGSIPKLILEGFGESDLIIGDDKVITEDDLKRYTIDPESGEVIPSGN